MSDDLYCPLVAHWTMIGENESILSIKFLAKKSNLFSEQMRRRFRCGRLILSRDGQLQSVGLREGGGTRVCPLRHPRMSLMEIYHQLLRLYKIGLAAA